MDDAALRVRPSGLRALVRVRADRERQALLELHARLADRDAAIEARDRAARELAQKESSRRSREALIYESLKSLGPIAAEAVAAHQVAIGRWSELVETAASRVAAAQIDLDDAGDAARDARARYAVRARAARKWTRIEVLVATARGRLSEAAAEREMEDDTLSRRLGPGSNSTRTAPR